MKLVTLGSPNKLTYTVALHLYWKRTTAQRKNIGNIISLWMVY